MTVDYRITDLGDRRVLTLGGRDYPTPYSARVVRLLVERKGDRAPLYFPFKATRAPLFLGPFFRFARARGLRDLSVLEIGCSFGHMTEYLVEQPEVASVATFDTDPAFVEIVRAKVDELGLSKVREVLRLDNDGTRRLPWPDGAFDLVLAIGVVEHLPERNRRAQEAEERAEEVRPARRLVGQIGRRALDPLARDQEAQDALAVGRRVVAPGEREHAPIAVVHDAEFRVAHRSARRQSDRPAPAHTWTKPPAGRADSRPGSTTTHAAPRRAASWNQQSAPRRARHSSTSRM